MNAVRLIKHYNRIAAAPNAVQELRRLVLDLAVRGKLVAQDPTDEPASVLIERIGRQNQSQNESQRLAGDVPFPVPQSWQWIRVGSLGVTQTGTTPSRSVALNYGNFIPFIRPADLLPKGVNYDGEGLSETGLSVSGRAAPAGSILMVCIGTIGKCQMIDRRCSFNQQINSLSPYENLSSKYLVYAMSTKYFQASAWGSSARTTIAILNKGNWEKLALPLPPVAEQHRIATKVDELMAICDDIEAKHAERETARDRFTSATLVRLSAPDPDLDTFAGHAQFAIGSLNVLTTRPDQIKQLRETILNLAVRGKLIPQDLENEVVADHYLSQPVSNNLPTNWRLLNFEKFFDIEGGSQPPKQIFIDKPRQGYIQLFQIRDFGSNPMPTYIPISSARRFCKSGDILIGRYGASVGKIFRAKDGSYNVAMAKFIYPPDALIPEYAEMLLRSTYFQVPISMLTRSAQAGFNKGDLASIDFPIPPLSEQRRILTKATELTKVCDQLEACLASTSEIRLNLLNVLISKEVG